MVVVEATFPDCSFSTCWAILERATLSFSLRASEALLKFLNTLVNLPFKQVNRLSI